ncbi:MAG: glutathione S-transferase N-terminal domain-containing protein [Myxococcota bacterium]
MAARRARRSHELASHRLGDPTLRTPEYRALNPGRVPTLEDEGVAFYESVAIVQYLLERHGGGRLEPEIEVRQSAGPTCSGCTMARRASCRR